MENTYIEREDRAGDGDEIHSEKVRKLLGEMPATLTTWGTAVICIILIALIAAVCLVPYPYSHGESILEHLLYKN